MFQLFTSLYRYTFFCLILFNSYSILSQDYRDVFIEKYNISKDSAKTYCNGLIHSNDANRKAFGLSAKGYVVSKESDYKNAEVLFDEGLKALEKITIPENRLEEKVYVLYYYSMHLLTEHSIEAANEKINEGLLLSKEQNNPKMQIKFNNLIGRSFSLLGMGEKAIKNGISTIEKIKSLEPKLSPVFYNQNLFYAYLNTGNRTLNFFLEDSIRNITYLDSSKHYLSKAEDFLKYRKLEASTEQKMHMLTLNADISFFKKEYQKAIEYYKQSIEISTAENLSKRVYQQKFALAECYFFSGDYETTKQIFDELSEKDLIQYGLLKNKILINYYYAEIYLKQGDAKRALEYTNTFNNQLDAYYKQMSDIKVNVFANSELRAKKEILDKLLIERKANTNLSTYLKIGIVLAVLLMIFIVMYLKQQKRKVNVKINALFDQIEAAKNKEGKESTVVRVNEEKAKKILQELKDLEGLELFTSKEYSLNMVAKKIQSNSAYVSQVINEYWKKSFSQYTNELRVNYILLKLQEDEIYQKFTLKAISESAGYKSLSSFNKHFKSFTGVTPKQYLNHLRNEKKKLST